MKLFRKKRKPVHNENWRFWDFYDADDNYGMITYDVTYLFPAEPYHSKAEFLLDITIPEELTVDGDFPSPEGQKELILLEDHLISTLEAARVDCLQVIRLTYDSRRTFVFEVGDIVSFLETMKSWTQSVKGFELNIEKEPAWTYYKQWEPTKYNWQQIGNAQVIKQLTKHGSNPEKIHKIECSFGGSPDQLAKLKQKLLSEEEAQLLLEEGDLLEIEYEIPLDHHEIDPLTFFLMDEAESFECKFEGWRAAIVK